MNPDTASVLKEFAVQYNRPDLFEQDPIRFPKHFAVLMEEGKASLQDVEVAAVIAAHLAWGRRDMIVRDCTRAFDEMDWQPHNYVMEARYRSDDRSLHRTIKWSDFAAICSRLKRYYSENLSLETASVENIRCEIYGQKPDRNAANKKINMMRRWMVRRDGIVDLGLWRNTDPASLIIPLDVHVHRVALEMGLTSRRSADARTAAEITAALKEVFPDDPCLGDFALFAYGVSRKNNG